MICNTKFKTKVDKITKELLSMDKKKYNKLIKKHKNGEYAKILKEIL